ncbi:DUF2884 family protein [Agaribacter marinus]|uniref:DUF2884 family protein n=1 Tax=Agaribacter marinus TaxID=1431249 RepID=A0AA37T235_9ALTE|nr:DUF2884 family protein [Agaribacter marinus]GLR72480.1 hypothetical protein GCM10007852_33880 [Agaribacter marinus]
MKKAALILSTIFCSMSFVSSAHEYGSIGNKCDIDFDGEIRITNEQLVIKQTAASEITILKSGQVIQDGKSIHLTKDEQATTRQYYSQVNKAVPQAVSLAEDAVDIAKTALTTVFTGFFGEDSDFVQSMGESISAIEQEVRSSVFPEEGVIVFGKQVFSENGNVSSSLESKIEDTVENLISEGMGEIFMALGKSMLSGDGNLTDFETRMDKLGEDIELEIESRAASLEHTAEAFCESLVELDETESKLQNIEAFENIDMIDVKQRA